MQLLITFTGASDFKSSSVADAAFSLKPFSMMVIRLSSSGLFPVFFFTPSGFFFDLNLDSNPDLTDRQQKDPQT